MIKYSTGIKFNPAGFVYKSLTYEFDVRNFDV
jgi:hypothetical protein